MKDLPDNPAGAHAPECFGFRDLLLTELIVNGDDARKIESKSEDESLELSMKSVGCLVPLLVSAPHNEAPYVIREGHRRYRVAKKIGLTQLPCLIYRTGAIDLGLIANVQRLDLDIVDKCSAITRLVALGRTEAEIRNELGILDNGQWRRTLKIGLMAGTIKEKVRSAKVPFETALALTAHAPDQQERVLKAAGGNKATAWQVRNITEQKGVPVEFALFAIDTYVGAFTEDLFSNRDNRGDDEQLSGRRFADVVQFKELQEKALLHVMKEHADAGELVYVWKRNNRENLHVEKHKDKRVKPATIFQQDESGYVQIHKNAQLASYDGQVLNVETGEVLKASGKSKVRETEPAKKAKDIPIADKAPFTKTGADHLKRQVAVTVAGLIMDDAHLAMAIATAALMDGERIGTQIDTPTTIGGGQNWPLGTMRIALSEDTKSEQAKRYGPVLKKIESTLDLPKLKKLKQLIDMKPEQLRVLFSAAVASTVEVNHYGNAIDEGMADVLAYLGKSEADCILFDDAFKAAISKSGALQWAKGLKLDAKKLETSPRPAVLTAIAQKAGSLEAARKALPPLTGTAPND